jgi:hypothetical protein
MYNLAQNGWSHDAVIDLLKSEEGVIKTQYRIDIIRGDGGKVGEALYTDCELSCDADAEIKYSGRITLSEDNTIDFARDFLRPVMFIRHDGLLFECPFTPLRPVTPKINVLGGYKTYDIDMFDALITLQGSSLGYVPYYPKGTVYTTAVQEFIERSGYRHVNIEPSVHAMAQDREEWEISDDKLQLANGLLEEINYTGLCIDRDGVVYAKPYREPAISNAGIRYEIEDFPWILPEKEIVMDSYKVPNIFIGTAINPESDRELFFEYRNTDPSSPTAIQNIGYERTEAVNYSHIATQELLADAVIRRASEVKRSYESITVPTIIMPHHELYETIVFNCYGVEGITQETGWSINRFGKGGVMKHMVRRIVYE